jgi:Lrp/AsnC family transcriptional regulator for asnA, asnC and gidA
MLNKLDTQLIELLQKEGRRSQESLATELGVSVMTVGRRIKSLVKQRVIHIGAAVDGSKVGNPTSVMLGLELEPGRIQTALKDLGNNPATLLTLRTMGRFDAIASMWFHSSQELSEFLEHALPGMRGIRASETLLLLRNVKWPYTPIPPGLIDSPDRDLIALLQEDGRRKNAELAPLLGMSRSTVGRRVNRLFSTKTLSVGAYPLPNPHEVTCVMGIRTRTGSLASISKALAAHAAVGWLNTCTGRFDLIALARFKDNSGLSAFVDEYTARLKGIVNIDVSLVTELRTYYEARQREYWAKTHPEPGTRKRH